MLSCLTKKNNNKKQHTITNNTRKGRLRHRHRHAEAELPALEALMIILITI